MALSDKNIITIEANCNEILENKNKIQGYHLNTFNYVAGYLKNWSEGTEIGEDVREKFEILNQEFTNLLNYTNEWYKFMEEFLHKQRGANNG